MAQDNTRNSLETHIGRLSQLGGISPFVHAEGKAKGTSTLRVRTATGLEFWVVPDRGIDIYEASYKGQSLCWHSPAGMVHPSYYSSHSLDWLSSFAGGLVCTCGLSTAGAPSEDAGEELGLHGPISNTPAENVSWSENWEGDDCVLAVSGKVRETSVFGPNLVLERTISTSLKSSSVLIYDVVENEGFKESPLMVLYHLNFGFPLLTERSKIFGPSQAIEPATEVAARTVDDWSSFNAPQENTAERVYFHRMLPDSTGKVTVVLVSDIENPELGVALSYDSKALPEFNQWKMTGTNHFVLGLEPANCRTLGRAAERQRGALQTIAPGERREFWLELKVLEGKQQVSDAIRESASSLPEIAR